MTSFKKVLKPFKNALSGSNNILNTNGQTLEPNKNEAFGCKAESNYENIATDFF